MPAQGEKASERQYFRLERRCSREAIAQQDRSVTQAAHLDVHADAAHPIGEHRVFAVFFAADHGQPRSELPGIQRFRMRSYDGNGIYCKHAGIEIGMPDKPCARSADRGVFSESGGPRPG